MYTISVAFKDGQVLVVGVVVENRSPRLGDAMNIAEDYFLMFNEVKPIESIVVRKDDISLDVFDGHSWANEQGEIAAYHSHKEYRAEVVAQKNN